jgi:hypothetical protein
MLGSLARRGRYTSRTRSTDVFLSLTTCDGPCTAGSHQGYQIQSTFLNRLKETELNVNYRKAICLALEENAAGSDTGLCQEEGLIFYTNRWYILDGRDLHQEMFIENHDSRTTGHFGQLKSAENIIENIY